MNSNKYVIIGGPCSGKTTTVNELASLGYHIVPEAATLIMEEWTSEGKKIDKLRKDENEFTKLILKRKIENEKKAPKNETVFFDRGIPDAMAYNRFYGAKTSEEIIRLCKNRNYSKVFFLEEVPYKSTDERIEDKETAIKLSKHLLEVYKELGYEVVFVPLMNVKERINFILEKIKK